MPKLCEHFPMTLNAQPKASHYINGKYVEDKAGKVFENLYPATGEVIATLHGATDEIVEQAIEAAGAAQKLWAKVPGIERGRILLKAAEIVRRRNDEIARIETLDTGKAIQETLYVDAVSAADNLEYFGHIAATTTSEHIPIDQNCFAYTLREPIGSCGCIWRLELPHSSGGVESRACARHGQLH